jgi:hypothetical protein
MMIYLDAMIVQYCADYEGFVFGEDDQNPAPEPSLAAELAALRTLAELAQLGDWVVAAPAHLMRELFAGKPSGPQGQVYRILLEAWEQSGWQEELGSSEDEVKGIYGTLAPLKLKDSADRWHLAEAIVLSASWFLTNDGEVLRKTRKFEPPPVRRGAPGKRARSAPRKANKAKNVLTQQSFESFPELPGVQAAKCGHPLLGQLRVVRPSECVPEISVGLFLR